MVNVMASPTPLAYGPFLHLEDDIPLTDPIVPPHTWAKNQTQNKKGGLHHGDTNACRGRRKLSLTVEGRYTYNTPRHITNT